ncbi:hypothetical protein Bca52824_082576 [Brassica carinata]|uniref:Uncharacterized protein n=1 Tax=Brassica carinata TaxID=52824 RepID=A0A8X7PJF2_BRACI|nr:hypothetical protein Bca52824_082576 [Brassica carinata]
MTTTFSHGHQLLCRLPAASPVTTTLLRPPASLSPPRRKPHDHHICSRPPASPSPPSRKPNDHHIC